MANPYPQPNDDHDDEPRASAPWLAMIAQAEKTFREYQERGDNIDKRYADAENLAGTTRDREYQLFWANVQVLAPSIYARPPVPVVVPRFRDRRPLPRLASEILERATTVVFDMENVDGVMRLARDDLSVQGRGVLRVRLEEDDGKRICIDHVSRRDFLMDPCRSWKECGWVAFAWWQTRDEFDKRFTKFEGRGAEVFDKYAKEIGATNGVAKIKGWEIWHKAEKKVVWVTEGVEDTLDEDKPPLDLEGFFPCPRPAFGTLQRGSMIPVQDFLFYKDQLEEINKLTNRIQALADAIKVRGFYAGGSDAGDAIETAIALTDDRKVLVPVPNWAALVQGNGDPIVWLPLDMIAKTIVQLVALRKELIADVYEITGLSDIMRGSTDPNETLGAQQLKSQYGSVRVRDRQSELVRLARDVAAIVAELLAEEMDGKTLLDMAQMEAKTDAEVRKEAKALDEQAKGIQGQMERAMKDPEFMQQAQANPDEAQRLQQEAEGQLQQLSQQRQALDAEVTIDAVVKLLRDQKTRPFVLDIETDSTIQPDEDAEKQRRAEFMQTLGNTLPLLSQMVQQDASSAPFAGEILKFALAPYRAGRELESAVDEFVEQAKQRVGQPQPNPEAEAAERQLREEQQRQQVKDEAERQRMERDEARKDAEAQRKREMDEAAINLKQAEAQHAAEQRERETSEKIAAVQENRTALAAKHSQDMERGALELERARTEGALATEKLLIARMAPQEPPSAAA